jgi:AcrR family transcriptional regulator
MTTPRHESPGHRQETETRFLDAAERLLVEVGYAGVTTRKLAEAAAANHGLVHYYFGSMEELFLQVLERFTERLIARQRELYASDRPYADKWREAIGYLDDDQPYQKIWWELQAMGWNRPQFRERIAAVHAAWSGAMRDAVAEALTQYELDTGPLSADEWVTLIVALNEGIILERLSGIRKGHEQLMAGIARWLTSLEHKTGAIDTVTDDATSTS